MLITYTKKEIADIMQIKDKYADELRDINNKMDEATDRKTRNAYILKNIATTERRDFEIQSYKDKCQKKRFDKIKGGSAGIIAHAKEQAPQILRLWQQEISDENSCINPKALKEAHIGTMKQGTLLINAAWAADLLKEELKLHLNALADDKQALQELLEVIIEAVENSPYTDNAEIQETTERPLDRYRRNPLADITTYGFMNDKTNTQMIQDDGIFKRTADGQITMQWAVNQAPNNKKKKQNKEQVQQVPVYIALTYDEVETGLSKQLSAFDNAVYNAVSDLFYYWKKEHPEKPLYITPYEIWRRMNGKQNRDGSAKPGEAQIKRICRSIDKMRHIDFYMDINAEINAHYITLEDERLTGGYLKDYLLNCTEVGFYTEQGRKVKGYRINMEPVLYTYNAAKDHVLFLPFDLLDTSNAISDGENVTEFKQYLMQQILLIKNHVRDNNKILLSSIYKGTGILTPEERAAGRDFSNEASRQAVIRRFRKADREKREGLLTAWKEKKWIKDYTALNKNNKPVGEKQQIISYLIKA